MFITWEMCLNTPKLTHDHAHNTTKSKIHADYITKNKGFDVQSQVVNNSKQFGNNHNYDAISKRIRFLELPVVMNYIMFGGGTIFYVFDLFDQKFSIFCDTLL